MSVFLLINGPNLNLLGTREPEIYGATPLAVRIPFIEIHLSNAFAREEFRQISYFSDIANSCLFGFGAYGSELALRAASHYVASAGG